MKTSAIIRIIIWSLIAVLLTCLLVVGIRGGNIFRFSFNINGNTSFQYNDKNLYKTGSNTVSYTHLTA